VLITVSRTIAQDDIVELEKLGAAKVYTPRTTTEEVIELIDSAVRGRR
jgi:methylmalonyl-CoA mutase cobalamin-binding subunit